MTKILIELFTIFFFSRVWLFTFFFCELDYSPSCKRLCSPQIHYYKDMKYCSVLFKLLNTSYAFSVYSIFSFSFFLFWANLNFFFFCLFAILVEESRSGIQKRKCLLPLQQKKRNKNTKSILIKVTFWGSIERPHQRKKLLPKDDTWHKI